MNHNIINKCLEELKKPEKEFRKDYVIGMLETLSEMTNFSNTNQPLMPFPLPKPYVGQGFIGGAGVTTNHEEEIPDSVKLGPVGKIG